MCYDCYHVDHKELRLDTRFLDTRNFYKLLNRQKDAK